jgi:lipopolysaccharide transport system ATP-binding protein
MCESTRTRNFRTGKLKHRAQRRRNFLAGLDDLLALCSLPCEREGVGVSSTTEPVLSIRELRKTYAIWTSQFSRMRALLGLARAARMVHALDGVTFEIRAGESVGVIGKNGSGKSTLMKILSRLGIPSSGEVTVRGRVQALLELGTGFHPDFSGRDNLYYSAILSGLSRREVDGLYASIVDFAELREVIDQPLRTYSSGMKMRLAFSVATALEPDLLLLDEVLAVGDTFFQMRCMERMQSFVERGGTLLLVSHDLSSILRMCPRTIWLDRGRIVKDGDSTDVLREYRNSIVAEEEARLRAASNGSQREGANFILERLRGTKQAEIVKVRFHDRAGNEKLVFRTGQYLECRARFRVSTHVDSLCVAFTLYRTDGVVAAQAISVLDGLPLRAFDPGEYEAKAAFDPLLLGPGDYVVSTALLPDVDPRDSRELKRYDVRSKADAINIERDPEQVIERGIVHHPVVWSIEG